MKHGNSFYTFVAFEELNIGRIVHKEVLRENGLAEGVAEDVEAAFDVGVAVGVVGAETMAGEVTGGDDAVIAVFEEFTVGAAFARGVGAVAVVDEDFHWAARLVSLQLSDSGDEDTDFSCQVTKKHDSFRRLKQKTLYLQRKRMAMETEKILTLKAVLLYIIKNSKPAKRDVYGIVKTAYFAQQMHLAEYGSPIFDDKIAALPFGPVPSTIYDILKISRGDKTALRYRSNQSLAVAADAIGFSKEFFSAKEQPDMDYLSPSDIRSLDASIEKVSKMTFDEIKSTTHGDEWARASKSRSKILDSVAIAREGGATEEMLSYLRSNIELQSVLG